MFELEKRFTLSIQNGVITHSGVVEIQRFFDAQDLTSEAWKSLNPESMRGRLPLMPYEWEWIWVVTQRAEYVGTFPKRVSNYLFKVLGLKCPASFVEQLGNLARRHADFNTTYEFEFVDRFDWRAGDFGDTKSCYWWAERHDREMLRENGALAVRFYADGRGIGRAWLVPNTPENDLHIIYGGYGFAGDATLTIARVVAQHVSANYKLIDLHNNGQSDGTPYINSGAGYLIGAADRIAEYGNHDLGWGEIYDTYCEACGTGLTDDEVYYGNDYAYCQDCYYERFDNCERCGESYYKDQIYVVDDRYLCQDCIDHDYVTCDQCGEYERDNAAYLVDDETLCQACYDKRPVPPEE